MVRSRGLSWTLGLLTLWPPLYVVGFVVSWFVVVAGGGLAPSSGAMPTWFLVLAVLHLATFLLGLVLLVVYVVDAVRNPRLEGSDMRVVWVVLIVLLAPGAMPVYWWVHLRPGSESFRARLA